MTATNTSIPARIVEAIRIVRDVAIVPHHGDKDATREWLRNVTGLASYIETPADEDMMSFLGRVLSNNYSFDPIYRLWIAVMTADRPLTAGEAALVAQRLRPATEQYGIDPLAVIEVIEALADLVRFIRDQ